MFKAVYGHSPKCESKLYSNKNEITLRRGDNGINVNTFTELLLLLLLLLLLVVVVVVMMVLF